MPELTKNKTKTLFVSVLFLHNLLLCARGQARGRPILSSLAPSQATQSEMGGPGSVQQPPSSGATAPAARLASASSWFRPFLGHLSCTGTGRPLRGTPVAREHTGVHIHFPLYAENFTPCRMTLKGQGFAFREHSIWLQG